LGLSWNAAGIARELERDVTEGTGHTGRGAVVQILARKVSISDILIRLRRILDFS